MLTRTRLKNLAGVMLLLVPMAAAASQAPARFAISTRQIADALASAGLMVSVSQVEFLSAVSTASDHALLQVVSTANRAAGIAIVKLRCHDNHECLPFYVRVHSSSRQTQSYGTGGTRLQLASERESLVEDTSFPRMIRGGDPAILILESADSRISMPVVCLQNGTRGQRIRVTSKDHRRFFEGEVIGTGMLKGSL
jgi:flagella basal body P-ring formation protein FlgA